MFITKLRKHYAYVTSTTKLLFHIVIIEIEAFISSVHKYHPQRMWYQVNFSSVSCFGTQQADTFWYLNFWWMISWRIDFCRSSSIAISQSLNHSTINMDYAAKTNQLTEELLTLCLENIYALVGQMNQFWL